MSRRRCKSFGRWHIRTRIGEGGNSVVFEAAAGDNDELSALKLLTTNDEEKRERFRREMIALQSVSDIAGVVPILDSSIDEKSADGPLWYTMPIGVPISSILENFSLIDRANLVLNITAVVQQLHLRGMAHRDIKPENFIILDDKIHLSDFGLIQLPDADELTRVGQRIGSYATIAPEMRHWTPETDAKPSDVYSLAKSLWMLLVNESGGFEGQYSLAAQTKLAATHQGEYLTPLHDLLRVSTDPDPERRLTVDGFSAALVEWIKQSTDLAERSPRQWRAIAKSFFPVALPLSASWVQTGDIALILGELAGQSRIHHVFFPDGGGLDLTGVAVYNQVVDCVELDFGGITALVRPSYLNFERFPDDSGWDYFLLVCDAMPQIQNDPFNAIDRAGVEYLELSPGCYANRKHHDLSEFRGEPLPETARVVTRYSSGHFLFVHRTSAYNRDSSTYDGRHNKMPPERFRQLIERSIEESKAKVASTKTEKGLLYVTERFEEDDFSWWADTTRRPKMEHLSLELYDKILRLAEQEREEREQGFDPSDLGTVINLSDIASLAEQKYEYGEVDKAIESLSDRERNELVAAYCIGQDLRLTDTPYVSAHSWQRVLKSSSQLSPGYLIGRTNIAPSLAHARRLFDR